MLVFLKWMLYYLLGANLITIFCDNPTQEIYLLPPYLSGNLPANSVGALAKPNGTLTNSYNPHGVVNAVSG